MKDGEEIPREPENSSASSVSGTEATPGNPVQPGPPSGEAVDHTPLTAAHQIERTATSSEADVKSEPAAGSETKSPESSNADEQKASAAEKNFLLRLADNLKALFTALSSAFLFLLLLALIVSLGMELARSTVFLDLSEVPKDLRDNGLSTIGISQQLADELVEIQRISLSKNTRFLLDPTWPQPDIQVPGSSISFHSVSQWLKQRLANPIANNDIHLTGEFTKDKDDYRLTIRRIDEHVNRNYSVTVQNRSISKALKLGAEAVAKLADPVTLATYYFYIEDRNDGYQKTIETIKYVIGWGDDQTRARAYNLWGNVLVDQGDAKQATFMYKEAVKYDNNLSEAYVNWGNALLFDLNDAPNAIRKFEAAIHSNRHFSPAYNGFGYALDILEKPNEALKKFQRAVETADSRDYWPYIGNAELLDSIGRREEALPLYQRARELIEEAIYRDETRPRSKTDAIVRNSDAYQAFCQILTSTGDFGNAIRAGERAVVIDETDPEAHRCLGVALQYVGRLEDSAMHLRRTLELRSTWYWAQNDLGNTLMRRGSYDEAEEIYSSLAKLSPRYAWGWYNWGRARLGKGDHVKAGEYTKEAAKLRPRAGTVMATLADVLFRAGKYTLSVKTVRSAIKLNRRDFGFHYQLAVDLNRLGKSVEAKRELRTVVNLAARLEAAQRRVNYNYGLMPEEYATWGWALHDLGQMNDAKRKFEHALKIDPASLSAGIGLADVLVSARNPHAATLVLEAVNQINPNDYFTHVALGSAFMADGQTVRAAEEFKRAMEIDKVFPDAFLEDAERLSLQRENEAALESAKHAAKLVPESKAASQAVGKYKAALGLY